MKKNCQEKIVFILFLLLQDFVLQNTMEVLSKNVYSDFIMKPLIKYRGGKSKEIPNIQKHIPQFSGKYIEPFLGEAHFIFILSQKMQS